MKNKDIQLNDIVNIQAFKDNGLLYRQWNGAKVIKKTKDYFLVLLLNSKVKENKSGFWIQKEPMFWYFPKDEFFNASVTLTKNNSFSYYSNISSPFIFEDNTIKYIDYDLDIKKIKNKKVKILDKKEFENNAIQFQYSDNLLKIINKTLEKVVFFNENKLEFFNFKNIINLITENVEHQYLPKKFLKYKNI